MLGSGDLVNDLLIAATAKYLDLPLIFSDPEIRASRMVSSYAGIHLVGKSAMGQHYPYVRWLLNYIF
jgi:hypothetical protein